MSDTDLNRTSQVEWQRTSPAAAIFYVGKIVQGIAQNAFQFLAPAAAFVFTYEGDLKDNILIAIVVSVVLVIVSSIVRYLFFRYCITDDSILIREGVFKKTQLDIKFDRVQAINTEQNIVYRALNLVTAKIDTAGSSGQEGNLPAIKPELAESLREKTRRRKKATFTEDDEAQKTGDDYVEKLLQLSAIDMVRIGVSDNRALIFLALLGPLAEQFERRIPDMFEESNVFQALAIITGINSGPGLIFTIIVGALLLLAIASIIGAFLRYHRYRLTFDSHVFQSTGGLLTKHVHSIDRAKIQTVVMRQNIVLRMLGRHRLDAKQATSGKKNQANANRKNFVVPICLPEKSSELVQQFLDEHSPNLETNPNSRAFASISPHYIRSRTVLFGVLPASAVTMFFVAIAGFAGLVMLLWVPISALCAWQYFRRYGVQVARDGVSVRRGFLGYRISTFLHRKVQRISVTQTYLQRRKSLATIRFFLASGSVRVPYVNYDQARILRDYVLYRVQSSQQAWH